MSSHRNSRIRSVILLWVATIGIVAGFYTAVLLVGNQARLVDVLTIFFTAFAGGAALVDGIGSLRRARRTDRD